MPAGHAAVMSSLDGPAAWHMAHGTWHMAHGTRPHRPTSANPSGHGARATRGRYWGRLLRGHVEVVDVDVDSSDAQLGEVGDGGDHVVADSFG